nr:ABC transporter ATP-binding protein [Hyphomonas sp. Mor2]
MPLNHSLTAKGISRSFAGRTVVNSADLSIEPGRVTALIGPSGSGKTTLLRMLAGMETPDAGTVHSGDMLLSDNQTFVPIEKRRIGLVFQDFALFPHLSVVGNVMFGLQNMPKDARASKADTWIERLGLSHRRAAYPHQLSGGEQQRTAIARALAPDPVAILLDEPFSGLDPAMREQVRGAALDAIRAANIPALLVTHDANEALVHADQIAVIEGGSILQSDTPETVYRLPQSERVARALGPVHSISTQNLPHPWQSQLGARGDLVHYRPEAIRIGEGLEFTVTRTRLAGAITEVELELPGSETIFAACQPGRTLQAGDKVNVSLNPELVFDFAEKTV